MAMALMAVCMYAHFSVPLKSFLVFPLWHIEINITIICRAFSEHFKRKICNKKVRENGDMQNSLQIQNAGRSQ